MRAELIPDDGGAGHDKGVVDLRPCDAQSRDHLGLQAAVRIVDLDLDGEGAGVGLDRPADERDGGRPHLAAVPPEVEFHGRAESDIVRIALRNARPNPNAARADDAGDLHARRDLLAFLDEAFLDRPGKGRRDAHLRQALPGFLESGFRPVVLRFDLLELDGGDDRVLVERALPLEPVLGEVELRLALLYGGAFLPGVDLRNACAGRDAGPAIE